MSSGKLRRLDQQFFCPKDIPYWNALKYGTIRENVYKYLGV